MKIPNIEKDELVRSLTNQAKNLKNWVDIKGPKFLRAPLRYSLDWLSPDLLGTGFKMSEISSDQLQAQIPAHKSNLNFQGEINQGLILNAALELARALIDRTMVEASHEISQMQMELVKKCRWSSDLILNLKISEEVFDNFFIDLDKKNYANLQLDFSIQVSDMQPDILKLKLKILKKPMLTGGR